MAGSTQYHEKCVCGAMLTITENYDFVSSHRFQKRIDAWRKEHKGCLLLFHQVQTARMKQVGQIELKLLKD